jgi:hypothetical protein
MLHVWLKSTAPPMAGKRGKTIFSEDKSFSRHRDSLKKKQKLAAPSVIASNLAVMVVERGSLFALFEV